MRLKAKTESRCTGTRARGPRPGCTEHTGSQNNSVRVALATEIYYGRDRGSSVYLVAQLKTLAHVKYLHLHVK